MTVSPRVLSVTGGRESGTGVAGATVSNGPAIVSAPAAADTALALVVGADETAVEAAVALLEADTTTPTQAHVNALRTVWNTLVTDAALAKTATAALTGAGILGGYDVVVMYDATAVKTRSFFRACLREVVERVAGGNSLTP